MKTEQANRTYTLEEVNAMIVKAIKQDREYCSQVLRALPLSDSDTKQGWIENPKSLNRVLTEELHAPTKTYAKLTAVCVHKKDEEYLDGIEFLRRAREKSGGGADQKAFDFYSKKENWHLLPDDVEVIVFSDTEFHSGDRRYVRYLYRLGALWKHDYCWVGVGFGPRVRVAVLAIGPKASES